MTTPETLNRAEAHRKLLALGMPLDVVTHVLDHPNELLNAMRPALTVAATEEAVAIVAAYCAARTDPLDTVPEEERERIVAAAEKAQTDRANPWRTPSTDHPETCPYRRDALNVCTCGPEVYRATIAREVAAYHTRTGGPEFQPGYHHPDPATDQEVRLDLAEGRAIDKAAGVREGWHRGWTTQTTPEALTEEALLRALATFEQRAEERARAAGEQVTRLHRARALGDTAALLRASRAAPAPASALPIDHPGVRDALRALAVAMCATQARDPEQKAQLQRVAEAHDALRYALGDKDPAAEDAIPPVRFPGDVSIPRDALESLVKATQYEDDVRDAREAAKRALHLDALRCEPARTDADAARRLAEARAERDRLDAKFRSYDGGDRPQSPPVSLIRDLRAAEERVCELEAAK